MGAIAPPAQHEMKMLDSSCCTDDRYQSYTHLLNSVNRP